MAIVRTAKHHLPTTTNLAPVSGETSFAPPDLDLTNLRVRIRRRPVPAGVTEPSLPSGPEQTASPAPFPSEAVVASAHTSLPESGSLPIAHTEPDTVSAPNPPKRRRGHATRDENGKWQPTGNYPIGFCMPPVHGQFKGKPGPGRPKGAKSQDTILRERFDRKREVRLDGVPRKLSQRELLAEMMFKDGLDPKGQKARLHLHAEAQRLYAPREVTEGHAPPPMADIRDMDRQLMAMVSGLMGIGDALPALDLVGTPADLPADKADDAEPWEDEQDWDAPDEPEEPSDGQ